MTVEAASWIGQSLSGGRYKVLSQLGEGGMGYVYQARDGNLDCDVVVKVPRRSLLEDPEFAARFTREVRSLVRLVHPHIVKVQDVGQHDGLPFAVMQYLTGGSLRDRQPRGPGGTARPMPPESLRDWLPGVAGALDFIHQQRYIHRDVKPDNILFDAHGFPFLSDFGVAKALVTDSRERKGTVVTGTGMVLGTPQYMAPELVLGKSFDGRVDQYALAIMVFELLSGRFPFDGPTAPAIFVQQSTQQPPLLESWVPTIPGPLALAVRRGMAKEPAERFADCSEFARAVLNGLSLAAAPASVPAREAAPSKRYCPACGKAFAVPPGAHGKRLRCPLCRAVLNPDEPRAQIVVSRQQTPPGTGRITPSIPEHRPTPPVTNSQPARSLWDGERRQSPIPWYEKRGHWVTLLVAAGMAVTACTVVITTLRWQSHPPAPPSTGGPAAPAPKEMPKDDILQAAPYLPPAPARFDLFLQPSTVALRPGEQRQVQVYVQRRGDQGSIELKLQGLPADVKSQVKEILADQNSTQLRLTASPQAVRKQVTLELVARGSNAPAVSNLWINILPPNPPPPTRPPPDSGRMKVPISVPAPAEDRVGLLRRMSNTKAVCVAIAPDGHHAVSGGPTNGEIIYWDLDRGSPIRPFVGHPQPVLAVAFSRDGHWGVSASEDGTVRLWNIETEQKPRVFEGHQDKILSVAISPDGQHILSGSKDGTARYWDVRTGEAVLVKSMPHPVNAVALSPDGRWALTASGVLQGEDNDLHLWNVQSGDDIQVFKGHTDLVTSVAFSPDGERILSGSADKTVILWKVAKATRLHTFPRQGGKVNGVAFTPDGRLGLSCSFDHMVCVWDLKKLTLLERFSDHKGFVYGIASSPNSRWALSASPKDGLYLWVLPKHSND
jgi:WD40 repeat protein/serine/threonine protein kinase